MKRYIKDTIFTILEAGFLLFLLTALLLYFGWHPFDSHFLCFAYLALLFILLLLKKLRVQWRRFRILHFSIRKIDRMSGIEFENYLSFQLQRMGFEVSATKASADYGADLILQKKSLRIAVQAKRYQGKIGVKAVQEVIGSMAYYEAAKGLVITNSTYTKNAENLANANDVVLWDRDVLIRLIARENMAGYLAELLE